MKDEAWGKPTIMETKLGGSYSKKKKFGGSNHRILGVGTIELYNGPTTLNYIPYGIFNLVYFWNRRLESRF